MTPQGASSTSDLPSMLVAFRASNVRSFRDEFELSFQATTLANPDVVRPVAWRTGGEALRLLPVGAIYGANASGKSNVLKAMADMRHVVEDSFSSWSPEGGTKRRAFRLDPDAMELPTTYQVDVVIDGVLHRYGFELNSHRITREWAYHFPRGRRKLLFTRENDKIDVRPLKAKGAAAARLLRPNALFLSTAAASGTHELMSLHGWLSRNMRLASSGTRDIRQRFTAHLLEHDDDRERVLSLMRAADLGITDIKREEVDKETRARITKVLRALDVDPNIEEGTIEEFFDLRLYHQGTGRDPIAFSVQEESLGTMVWLGLVGPVIEALAHGLVLLADELDASLHPALTSQIVRLFQDPETNPRRAQLVFNTHDATLIDSGRLGRDQIWFCEKDTDGATRLYPLSDHSPRKDEAVSTRYLHGRYGGVPIIAEGDFDYAAELIALSHS